MCYMLTLSASFHQENVKKYKKKLMKILNIERENFHIF